MARTPALDEKKPFFLRIFPYPVAMQGAGLNIGDSAPAFKVDRWYKGAAVPAFERGRIYVVEFWATWCGPCKEAIPHITELARKYKDTVTVTGVSVAEEGDNIPARIEKFVAQA